MAASRASIMMRSDDARSRVARVLESAALSRRARLSLKVLIRSSSWRVRMPSLIAWVTPCRKPSSRALLDVLFGGSGALGDGQEGLPYGSLVEGVGGCRLGGELDHLGEACLVGLAALGVGALQDAGLLVAVAADAVQGLKEFGEGHGFLFVVCGLGGRGSLFYGGQGYPRWVSVCGVVLWLWKCLDIDLSRDNQGRLCELRSLNGGCRTH